MLLQSVFRAIELTLTLEFFSLFQQLSLMTTAQNTVYVVIFAIRKADLSFLPYSKHISSSTSCLAVVGEQILPLKIRTPLVRNGKHILISHCHSSRIIKPMMTRYTFTRKKKLSKLFRPLLKKRVVSTS